MLTDSQQVDAVSAGARDFAEDIIKKVNMMMMIMMMIMMISRMQSVQERGTLRYY